MSTTEDITLDPIIELFTPDTAHNPHPCYQTIREECPVKRVQEGFDGQPVVYISRYEDVCWALKHPEYFSSAPEAVDIGQEQKLIPLQVDPPDHAPYRRLLDPEFSPKKMAALKDEVRDVVNGLIDGFIERGQCDFHEDFATPLPSSIFLALMGLPREDLVQFLRWRDETIRPDVAPDDFDGAAAIRERVGHEITEYFNRRLDERAANPDDSLISRIAVAQVGDRPATREEQLGMCHLLLLGGLDTVTATLDCMVGYLAHHPDRRQQLAQTPELIDGAVEEMLRRETPVMIVVRVVKKDVELGGVQLKAGDHATIVLGAANADDAEFDHADEVDFERSANRHVAFGAGPHRCLGSHLARLELRVALEEWHRRIPDYRVVDGTTLEYSPAIRQASSLPLVWG